MNFRVAGRRAYNDLVRFDDLDDLDEGDLPGRRRSSHLGVVVALAILVGGGTTIALHVATGAEQSATVPALVGLTEEAARQAVARAGLILQAQGQVIDPVVPAGSIARQQPLAGARVPPATVVLVMLSRGIASLVVPQLAGLPVEAARTRLEQAGLRVGSLRSRWRPGLTEGMVIASEPPAGTALGPGSPVNLLVAGGSPDARGR